MAEETYEAPAITELGRVEDLTQTVAKFRASASDGYTYNKHEINS